MVGMAQANAFLLHDFKDYSSLLADCQKDQDDDPARRTS
jgi:hypothetical protein